MDTHHFQSPAMTDPTRLEPRNGDFVAYVEALQEESLEALRRANQAAIANPLQVPDASEGGADLGRIAAEMQRRARAERGDEATHDVLRRTKKSVAESFRRMGGATRGSTRAPLLSLSLTLPPRHPPQGAILRRADGACRSASSAPPAS